MHDTKRCLTEPYPRPALFCACRNGSTFFGKSVTTPPRGGAGVRRSQREHGPAIIVAVGVVYILGVNLEGNLEGKSGF